MTENEEAFVEGMKIALYATTDILPLNRKLAEQTAMLYFPYNEESGVIQQSLISIRVVARACTMGSWNLKGYYLKWKDFLLDSKETREEKDKRWGIVGRKKGNKELRSTYNLVQSTLNYIFDSSQEPLFDEDMLIPKGTMDPLWLAFKSDDPLNQKFERVLSENKSRTGESAQSHPEEVASRE